MSFVTRPLILGIGPAPQPHTRRFFLAATAFSVSAPLASACAAPADEIDSGNDRTKIRLASTPSDQLRAISVLLEARGDLKLKAGDEIRRIAMEVKGQLRYHEKLLSEGHGVRYYEQADAKIRIGEGDGPVACDGCVPAPIHHLNVAAHLLDHRGQGNVVGGLHAQVLEPLGHFVHRPPNQVEPSGTQHDPALRVANLRWIGHDDQTSQEHSPCPVHQEAARPE